jgi:hypothetical protein
VDVGLIEIEDITQWKTDFPGFAPVMPVLDLYNNSFSMQPIGQKVVGNAAVTGMLRGEISGLFYRYKSMGHLNIFRDFLIGPETKAPDVKNPLQDRRWLDRGVQPRQR